MFSANLHFFRLLPSSSPPFSRPSRLDYFRQNIRYFGNFEQKNSIQQKRTINLANLLTPIQHEGIIGQIQLKNFEQPKIGKNSNKSGLNFENGEEAFKSKTNLDLIRGLMVFRCCQSKWLVQNNQQILSVMRNILGAPFFNKLLKSTFYGHFVAGETLEEVSKTVSKLQKFSVQSILDYSVEQDIGQKNEMGNEEEFDKNVGIFCRCIDSTAEATKGKGFTVVKLTALGRPELLMRLTECIDQMKRIFNILAGSNRQIPANQLIQMMKNIGVKMDKAKMRELEEWIGGLPKNGILDSMEWEKLAIDFENLDKMKNIFDGIEILNMKTDRLEPLVQNLTPNEIKECAEMNDRLYRIAEYAKNKQIRLMIDAEQTYFQSAISRFALSLMKKYNTENAQILNTYQAYLRSGLSNLLADMNLARRENFHFGCKLVRGAYMEQERKRAAQNGLEDPINGSHQATSKMYHRCLEAILDEWTARGRGKVWAMVASHNLETIKFAMELMRQKGIGPGEGVIAFGQLYGMSDAISFTQAQSGYNIFKYIPWGPVEGVLPYLSRRALENGAMLEKVGEEKKMLWGELKRRLAKGEWVQKELREKMTLGPMKTMNAMN